MVQAPHSTSCSRPAQQCTEFCPKQNVPLLQCKAGFIQQYVTDGTQSCSGPHSACCLNWGFISLCTGNMLKLVAHLMHQRQPRRVQQDWQQGGGAAASATKRETQRVTQGQSVAVAALALLGSALAGGELWGPVVESWPAFLEALQSMTQLPLAQQCACSRTRKQ